MGRKIGEKFKHKKIILEVKEGYRCDKCFFGYIDDSEFVCLAYYSHYQVGNCNGESRTDGKDIFFEKIGEVNDENN